MMLTGLTCTASSTICLNTSIASSNKPFLPKAPIMVFQEITLFSEISWNKSLAATISLHLAYIEVSAFFS
uniref:Uncharacterized protein n=1 Tax=Rhizophora mucronata TaxID=61149 RepID=A0A2P2NGH0_RHIMU